MGIFILLILAVIHVHWIFGLVLGFFVIYQFIDAIQTAKALQMGQPAPDPLGMGQIFSPGQKVDSSKIPLGAVILIASWRCIPVVNQPRLRYRRFLSADPDRTGRVARGYAYGSHRQKCAGHAESKDIYGSRGSAHFRQHCF